jgi:hypothetical protein
MSGTGAPLECTSSRWEREREAEAQRGGSGMEGREQRSVSGAEGKGAEGEQRGVLVGNSLGVFLKKI